MLKLPDEQLAEVMDIVLAYAQLDFSKRIELSGDHDQMNALANAINMLGEELQATTISVHEKETLLREMHHRVKNNLQIISSILKLQASSIDQEDIQEKFAQCITRVHSISLLHEKLYNSYNVQHIEINDYLISLCRSLMKTLPSEQIEFSFVPMRQDFHTDIDHLLPLGLILNELMTNAIKHAFPDDRSGKLTVGLTCQPEKKAISIVVRDNGVGFDQDLEARETLGLYLIEELCSQINGAFSVEQEQGTKCTLTFELKNSPCLFEKSV